MKCNKKFFILSTLPLALSSAYAASGFGSIAENLIPQIGFGYSLITIVLGIMSACLWAYTYNLWSISRRSPQMAPLHRVFMALIISIFCTVLTVMDRPGNTTTIQPIPIVKPKKYTQSTTPESYKNKHWSNKKSTQNNN